MWYGKIPPRDPVRRAFAVHLHRVEEEEKAVRSSDAALGLSCRVSLEIQHKFFQQVSLNQRWDSRSRNGALDGPGLLHTVEPLRR